MPEQNWYWKKPEVSGWWNARDNEGPIFALSPAPATPEVPKPETCVGKLPSDVNHKCWMCSGTETKEED